MMLWPNVCPVYQSSPMPPSVLSIPFSTTKRPGPTICHPLRSFPSNSCFQSEACETAASRNKANIRRINNSFYSRRLVRRYFRQRDLSPEAVGLERAVDKPREHPDGARDQHRKAQTDPDSETDHEAERGKQTVQPVPAFTVEEVVHERRGIDTHECDEGAEIQQLRAKLIAHQKAAGQYDGAGKQDIVARDVSPGLDRAEEAFRDGVVAAHA